MKYLGIQSQIRRNNLRSFFMLLLFPILVAVLVWFFFFLAYGFLLTDSGESFFHSTNFKVSALFFTQTIPWIIGACALWFLIAYFINVNIIKQATSSHTLDRQTNKRVYNLVENLCMTQGMQMPKINVIEDRALNAFASGINNKTYTVTLTRGLIDSLNDEELEGVISHELMHIRNRDVRLLIISIVFVGIFASLSQILMRSLSARGKKNAILILIGIAVVALGYMLSSMMRFGISRKREYMADAGAAEMTKKPLALASSLRKIANNPHVSTITNKNVSPLFIENALNKNSFSNLFATHPPISKRIKVLEQF